MTKQRMFDSNLLIYYLNAIAILNDLYLVPTLQRWNPSVTLRVTPL